MKTYLLFFMTYLSCVAQTFAQNQEIRLFSHRGGRMEHDENTLRAFEVIRQDIAVLRQTCG